MSRRCAVAVSIGVALGTIVGATWVRLEEGRRVGRPDQLESGAVSIRVDEEFTDS